MKHTNISIADKDDIDEIAILFRLTTDQMILKGIDQWDYTYPLASHIEKDIENKSAFIWKENNEIAATITLDQNQDSQYQTIKWQEHTSKVLVIHRLAVHPDFQGIGLSKKLCLFAETVSRLLELSTIRLDAYSRNPISNQLYESLGYLRADGYCYFHNNPVPFFCYDKLLK